MDFYQEINRYKALFINFILIFKKPNLDKKNVCRFLFFFVERKSYFDKLFCLGTSPSD